MKAVPSSFAGHELVDWLLMVGLAHDRTDAVKYGRRLLDGRVIRHAENLHHFHDQPLFYTFVLKEDGFYPLQEDGSVMDGLHQENEDLQET